mgnify:FL=1
METTFHPEWLGDPRIFAVNRLPACSDHEIFATWQEAEANHTTLVRSLDGTWRAHLALRAEDAPEVLIHRDDHRYPLHPMTVPGEFQLQYPQWDAPQYVNVMYPWDGHEEIRPPEVSEHNPTVTAIRCFSLGEEELNCGRVVLTLNAVETAAAVYMNGSFVGYCEDSFTAHRFDVTPYVHKGENRLVLQVFKRSSASWLEDQDFWRFSGIHRSVTLTFEPRTHLEDIFVHTPLEDDFQHGRVTGEMKILRPVEGGKVYVRLQAPDGREAGHTEKAAAENVSFELPLEKPELWSAESPKLYTLRVTLADTDGQEIELSRVMVGVRRFEKKNRIMCLNGKRVVFHGVNRHEFDWEHGRAVPLATLEKDIRILKELNVNAVRTSHYPNCTEFYRLCDQYGLYVIDETNIETHGTWSRPKDGEDRTVPGDREEWLGAVLDRGSNMQERDKNHACILLWSCGNESFGGKDLYELSQMFRRRDPSRLVHYEGVRLDPRYPDTTDVHSTMYHKPEKIEEYLQNDPVKPFINCEYIHAMGNSCGGMSLYNALEDKYPMYQGGFIWDYVDQGLKMKSPHGRTRMAFGGDWGDRPTDYQFIANGIAMSDRKLSPKAQEVRYLFQLADITPAQDGVTIRSRRSYTTWDDCELKWEMLLDGMPYDSGVATLPAIEPGETVFLPQPWEVPFGEGEVSLTCRLCLKEAEGVLPAGYALATGQAVLSEADAPVQDAKKAKLICGDSNFGVKTDRLQAMFGRGRGKANLNSFKDGAGREILLRSPDLTLFRAPTDNDDGNGDSVRQGIWLAASRCHFGTGPEVDVENAALTYRFQSPLLPDMDITLRWEVTEDALKATLIFPGVENQPDLPELGLTFQLDPRLNHVHYYGLGPDESYNDRCQGALLGVYDYAVEDGWTRYIHPQESGNRMGVRYLTVTGEDGHGIRIEQVDAPLEIEVSPWLPEELHAKWHPDELQDSCRTVLDVAAFRKGVGGDDSWGAPVHPEYTYPSNREYRLTFLIKGI